MKTGNIIRHCIVLFCLIAFESISYSSPFCLGCTSIRFRKAPLEFVDCNCPCQKYPRSKHGDGYGCLVCGHKLLPREITGLVPAIAKPKQTNQDAAELTIDEEPATITD